MLFVAICIVKSKNVAPTSENGHTTATYVSSRGSRSGAERFDRTDWSIFKGTSKRWACNLAHKSFIYCLKYKAKIVPQPPG